MLKNETLENIFQLLSRKYPEKISSRLEMEVWNNEVSLLESRLMMAFSLNSSWLEGPKFPSLPRLESINSTMSTSHVRQARLLVEHFIMDCVSSDAPQADIFPFREFMSKLLEFKSLITQDPALRIFYMRCSVSLRERVPCEPFSIAVLPSDVEKKAAWHKNYGFYSSILGLSEFNGNELSSLKFDKAWVERDEGVMLMLFSYLLKTKQRSRLSQLLPISIGIEKYHPTIKGVNLSVRSMLK